MKIGYAPEELAHIRQHRHEPTPEEVQARERRMYLERLAALLRTAPTEALIQEWEAAQQLPVTIID